MAKITVPETVGFSNPQSGGFVEKPINLTRATWHAQIPGGGAVNITTGWTDPVATEADRIPELFLAAGGTPGTYVLTGTYDGEVQTESILTVANDTVKGEKPFDTMTSLTGPDPVNALDIYKGDSYANPCARALAVNGAGVIACRLEGEDTTSSKTVSLLGDWQRRVRRVEHSSGSTTATGLSFVW
jgi:hypothetical protein